MNSEPAASEPAATPSAGGAARRSGAAAQSAFVLHSYDWSETSLIVELFTRDTGRVVAAAKGAKRPTSQLRALLMPFQPVAVQFARSRGDLGEVRTLRTAEWGGGEATVLQGSDWFSGFYLNELLLRMLARDDPHPRLFDVYAATLRSLGRSEAGSEAALRAFELLLLRESGVLPDLGRITPTQKALAPVGGYLLRADQGLVEAAAGEAAITGESWLALSAALERWAGQPVDGALRALQAACARELPALKTVLRGQLHYHLGGAPLRTRQLVLDTQRLLEANSPPR